MGRKLQGGSSLRWLMPPVKLDISRGVYYKDNTEYKRTPCIRITLWFFIRNYNWGSWERPVRMDWLPVNIRWVISKYGIEVVI